MRAILSYLKNFKIKNLLFISLLNLVIWITWFVSNLSAFNPISIVFAIIEGVVLGLLANILLLCSHIIFRNTKRRFYIVIAFVLPNIIAYSGITLLVRNLPQPTAPINKTQGIQSPNKKYFGYMTISNNKWRPQIIDSKNNILFQDSTIDWDPFWSSYWVWDKNNRFWIQNSDDGKTYFYEFSEEKWQKFEYDIYKVNAQKPPVLLNNRNH